MALNPNEVAIDGLPVATLPLAGTEPTVIVQGGVTRQTPINTIPGTVAAFAFVIQSAAFTAAWGARYGLNTSTTAIGVTLPVASLGNAMEVSDVNKNAQTNHITLIATSPNQIVYGTTTATNQTISVNGAVVRLVCYATNRIRALLLPSA